MKNLVASCKLGETATKIADQLRLTIENDKAAPYMPLGSPQLAPLGTVELIPETQHMTPIKQQI